MTPPFRALARVVFRLLPKALLIGAAATAGGLAHANVRAYAPTRGPAELATLGAALASPAPERKVLVWKGADVDGDGASDFANPTGKAPRTHDAYGEGRFGASRDGGSRAHEGVDYTAEAGQTVAAPISGVIAKIGYAYSDHPELRFVEIVNPAIGYVARVFYVDPVVAVGDTVRLGEAVGRAHSLQAVYPGGMTDHVHLELMGRDGVRIDMAGVLTARYASRADAG